jgi:Protein of unknown function (DUF4236)
MNLIKRSASLGVGRRALMINIGKKGVRETIGLPRSGLSYQTKLVKLGKSMTPAHVVTTLAILVIIWALMRPH